MQGYSPVGPYCAPHNRESNFDTTLSFKYQTSFKCAQNLPVNKGAIWDPVLVSFISGRIPQAFLDFRDRYFEVNKPNSFVDCPSIWVYLRTLHQKIWLMCQGRNITEIMFCSFHRILIRWHVISLCPFAGDVDKDNIFQTSLL